MNSIRNRGKAFSGICILAWSVLVFPAWGQTSRETGDALEQTSLTWNSTRWTVGMQVRNRADVMVGTCPAQVSGPVLQTTITGPAKLVFDWTVGTASSAAVLGLSVDGHELALDTSYLSWRCIELQIPAGTHAVAWRPLPGATIYLDNVIYDAGQTMGFVLGLNDGDAGVWAVHTGSFAQTAAAARDGLTSAAQLLPDQDGQAVAYRLTSGLATEAVGLSYWQRQLGNGHGASSSPLLSVKGDQHALSARDTAQGDCLVIGPGILSFMLAQDGRSIFRVWSENQETYYYSSDAHGWEHVSVLIPPGPQRITFSESYCEPTDGTEIAWIDGMHFIPGGFAQWRASTLSNIEWGVHWEYLDSDADGVTDVFEYAFGTNATKETPASGPGCTLVNGQLRLQFPTLPYNTNGLRYAVDGSSDMVEWTELAVVPASASLTAGPTLTVPAAPRRYVRTRILID